MLNNPVDGVRRGLRGLAVLFLLVSTAQAQWNPDPRVRNPVTIADSAQLSPAIVSDGKGGAIIAWEDRKLDTLHVYIFLQRMDDRGRALWQTNGMPITTCLEDFQRNPLMCSDGASGAIIAWPQDTGKRQVYAQRIDSSGNARWTCAGAQVNAAVRMDEMIGVVSDHAGGAYVTWWNIDATASPLRWNVYAQRINAAGTPVWSAPLLVASVTRLFRHPVVAADSSGNLFLAWVEYMAPEGQFTFRVQRVSAQGITQWAGPPFSPSDTVVSLGTIMGDEHGGVFVLTTHWASTDAVGLASVGHIMTNGKLAWSHHWAMKYRTGIPHLVPDGKGGAIAICRSEAAVTGYDTEVLLAHRVDSAGTKLWGDTVVIHDPGGISIDDFAAVPDGDAGVMAAWSQQTSNAIPVLNAKHLYAAHIDSLGKSVWGTAGKVVCTADSDQTSILAVPGYRGQMLCAWVDYRDTATRADIYATKLGDPMLALRDTIVDFGKVNVGDTAAFAGQRFIRNDGVAALDITQDNVTGPNTKEFSITNDSIPVTLQYRDALELNVAFMPASAGAKSADIRYTSNTAYAAPVMHLRGRGVVPQLKTIPRVDFGNQPVFALRDSTVMNIVLSSGSGFLHVDSIKLTGASGAFVLDSGNIAPVILDSGKALRFRIGFTPKKSGRVIDSIFVFTNTSAQGLIQLLGTGVQGALQASVTEINFGDVPVNTPADSVIRQLARNAGQANVVIQSRTITGPDASQFFITSAQTPATIVPGGLDSLALRFYPGTIGPKTATLEIVVDTPDTLRFALIGNGTASAARHAVLAVQATDVNMGDTLVGAHTDSLLATWIRNTGDTDLVVSAMPISGTDAQMFTVDDSSVAFVVPVGSSTSITVHFAPTSAGTKTADLHFTSNSLAAPIITLSGSAHTAAQRGALRAASNLIDCGSSGVGSARGVMRKGFLKNVGGASLRVTALTVAGTDAPDFVPAPFMPYTIAPGDSADVALTLTPSGVGARTATLIVNTDIGDSAVIALVGNGSRTAVAFSIAAINFGSVAVGDPLGATLPDALMNTGTDTVTITGLEFAGVDAIAFTAPGVSAPLVIAPGGSAVVPLRFDPLHTGMHYAEVRAIAGIDTVRAQLAGRGVRRITLSIGGAEGTPGTIVELPVTADASLSGTLVLAVDLAVQYPRTMLFPLAIVTAGTSTQNWNVSGLAISNDTVTATLTGNAPLAAGTLLCTVQGMILQSSTVRGTVALRTPSPAGDSDVTMAAGVAGSIVMDTLCGYGTQTFSISHALLIVWQPAPNPSDRAARIHYRLGVHAEVVVEMRDALGRTVCMLTEPARDAGDYDCAIDVSALPPGVYSCIVRGAGTEVPLRVVVAR